LELGSIRDARQLVGKRDEEHRLLMDSPSTRPASGRSESSTPTKSPAERTATLSRTAATADVDDSASQTSSSCPTSSSSTGTTSPTVHDHQAVSPDRTAMPRWPVTAAVGGIPSRAGQPTRPVVAVCRVRPLTDVDWRRGAHLDGWQRATSTWKSPPEAVTGSGGVRSDRPGDDGPVRREAGMTATPLSARRCIVPPSDVVPRRYDDGATSNDIILTVGEQDVMMAESKVTVYDNVQHLHV